MCWFIIDPKTGRYGRHVKTPSRRGDKLYIHNLAFDSFFDIGWAFQRFLAPHRRPPFDDLVAFIIDGESPKSLLRLPKKELAFHQNAFKQFWDSWNKGEEGYEALLGRPMLREERYWLLQHWIRRLAVGREQFYEGKRVVREEWLVNWSAWDGKRWGEQCYGRLRVFSDGSADAWYRGIGLLGYDNEVSARRELEQARFSAWGDILNEMAMFPRLQCPAPPPPSAKQRDDSKEPFQYEGS
jgi:hypothetical protein